jgi:iron complex outermembrane receptor protein
MHFRFAFLGLALCLAPLLRAEEAVLLPPCILSASRDSASAGDLSASSLIFASRWEDRALPTLRSALAGAPGLLMLESFGGFEPPRLSLRGSGVQSAPTSRGVLLTLDHLPLNLADGSLNLALFDPLLATQAAVYRGLSSWREPGMNCGGVIDLTSSPVAGAEASLRADAGSFGALRLLAKSVLASDKALRAQGALSLSRQDGWRPHSAQERWAALGTVGDGSGSASVYAATLRYEVPGPLTLAAARSSPDSVSTEVMRDAPRRESKIARLALRRSWSSADHSGEAGLSFARTWDDFRQLQPLGLSRSASDDLSWRVRLQGRVELAQLQHDFTGTVLGLAGLRNLERRLNNAGSDGAVFADDRLRALGAVAGVEDRILFSRTLSLSLGASLQTARREAGVAGGRIRDTGSRLLPQASVTWKAFPKAALFCGVAGASEAPTFDDLLSVGGAYPNLVRKTNSLAPQRATTWEAGLRGGVGRVQGEVVVYQGLWQGEILRLADDAGVARGAVNAGRTLHEGVETALRWNLLSGPHWLRLESTASWTQGRFAGDPVYGDRRLAGLPPHQGRAEFEYGHPGGGFAVLGLDWTGGRTFADHKGALGYGGQTLAHARVGWKSTAGWTVFLEANNLTDRRWIASTAGVLDVARNPAATSLFLPGSPRSFSVGFSWRGQRPLTHDPRAG